MAPKKGAKPAKAAAAAKPTPAKAAPVKAVVLPAHESAYMHPDYVPSFYNMRNTRVKHPYGYIRMLLVAESEYQRQAGLPGAGDPELMNPLPSMLPPEKLCDLTLKKCNYTDPTTQIRFADADAAPLILHLPKSAQESLRNLRQAKAVE